MSTHLISSMTIALQTEIALADPGKGAPGAPPHKSGKYTFFHNLATILNIFDIFPARFVRLLVIIQLAHLIQNPISIIDTTFSLINYLEQYRHLCNLQNVGNIVYVVYVLAYDL